MDIKVNKFLYVIVIAVLYFFIYCILFGKNLRKYLDENWRTVRCYPHIIPIAGLSSRPDGNNFFSKTFSNFNKCTSGFIKSIMNNDSKAFVQLLYGIKILLF